MKKKTKVLLGIVGALAIFVAVAPLILGVIARKVIATPPIPQKPLTDASLRMKVHGKITNAAGHTLLTTGKSNNTYVLTGGSVGEINKFAGRDEVVYVFGYLQTPNPREVNGAKVAFNIDVTKFDTKELPEQTLTPNEMADIARTEKEWGLAERQKIIDERKEQAKEQKEIEAQNEANLKTKIAFRDKVLAKVNKKSPRMDVITGKLKIGNAIVKGKDANCLLVQDIDGVIYVLSNRYEAVKASIADFQRFKGMDMEVVVVGEFDVPDEDVVVPQYPNRMTFVMTGIYTPDLKPFIQ